MPACRLTSPAYQQNNERTGRRDEIAFLFAPSTVPCSTSRRGDRSRKNATTLFPVFEEDNKHKATRHTSSMDRRKQIYTFVKVHVTRQRLCIGCVVKMAKETDVGREKGCLL